MRRFRQGGNAGEFQKRPRLTTPFQPSGHPCPTRGLPFPTVAIISDFGTTSLGRIPGTQSTCRIGALANWREARGLFDPKV
jgi:hypothetical protein